MFVNTTITKKSKSFLQSDI